MLDDRFARTASWLRSIDPSLTATRGSGAGYVSLDLPGSPGADYFFRVILTEHEYSLAAVLLSDPEAPMFWHQSFERLGAESLDLVEPGFRDFVVDVISHESRIIQHRGLLFHRFTCEVLRGEAWERVGGRILALRTRIRVPWTSARTQVYSAPPLVAATHPPE